MSVTEAASASAVAVTAADAAVAVEMAVEVAVEAAAAAASAAAATYGWAGPIINVNDVLYERRLNSGYKADGHTFAIVCNTANP